MNPLTFDLLDETEHVLRNMLARSLSGELRYLALLTANSVAMVRREATVAALLEASRKALSGCSPAEIRHGTLDGDASLHARLCCHAALGAWVADPDGLSEAQQRQYLQGTRT